MWPNTRSFIETFKVIVNTVWTFVKIIYDNYLEKYPSWEISTIWFIKLRYVWLHCSGILTENRDAGFVCIPIFVMVNKLAKIIVLAGHWLRTTVCNIPNNLCVSWAVATLTQTSVYFQATLALFKRGGLAVVTILSLRCGIELEFRLAWRCHMWCLLLYLTPPFLSETLHFVTMDLLMALALLLVFALILLLVVCIR